MIHRKAIASRGTQTAGSIKNLHARVAPSTFGPFIVADESENHGPSDPGVDDKPPEPSGAGLVFETTGIAAPDARIALRHRLHRGDETSLPVGIVNRNSLDPISS